MPPLFTLPTDFASTTLAIVGSTITPFAVILEVVVGVILAVLAVVILIRVLTHH